MRAAVSRLQLMREVWGYSAVVSRTVDIHVPDLRRETRGEPVLASLHHHRAKNRLLD
jgi:DNA-binding response OmpR family regulator